MIGTGLPVQADALCPLVAELNRTLVASTDYAAVPCPEIGFSLLGSNAGLRSQAGAYFPDTGRIELAPDLDLTTAYGQSFLLHELIHAAQFGAGADRRARCPAALEAEAYQVQAPVPASGRPCARRPADADAGRPAGQLRDADRLLIASR